MPNKKTFLVTIHEDLLKELEKRAERDKLSVQELINLILWRSTRVFKRKRLTPRKAEKFLEIFSRYQPYHKSEKRTYYCYKCKKRHRYLSDIGEKHLKYSDK
jgi:hypothetical protein